MAYFYVMIQWKYSYLMPNHFLSVLYCGCFKVQEAIFRSSWLVLDVESLLRLFNFLKVGHKLVKLLPWFPFSSLFSYEHAKTDLSSEWSQWKKWLRLVQGDRKWDRWTTWPLSGSPQGERVEAAQAEPNKHSTSCLASIVAESAIAIYHKQQWSFHAIFFVTEVLKLACLNDSVQDGYVALTKTRG